MSEVVQLTENRVRKYSINEIFGPTMQGEGALAGALTHFVRFNGCDYRCSWCDSMEAVDPKLIQQHHTPMTTLEILKAVRQLGPAHWVTLSGGNPALQQDLGDLIDFLQMEDFKVACETQGSIYQPWMEDLNHLVLSPKPPSAAWNETREAPKIDWKVISRIVDHFDNWSLKIVVFSNEDLIFAVDVGRALCAEKPLYIQVGTKGKEDSEVTNQRYRGILEQIHRTHAAKDLDIRVLPQLHKMLWGHGRGV